VKALYDAVPDKLFLEPVDPPGFDQEPGEVVEALRFRPPLFEPLADRQDLLEYPGTAEEGAGGQPPYLFCARLKIGTALPIRGQGLPVPCNCRNSGSLLYHASRKLAARFAQPAAKTACELAALISPP
jgi:hypothetical protein